MTNNYPRDLRGYGANPPDPHWPGGARLALQIVLNYEEGGENCVLHGDQASEAFLSEIVYGGNPNRDVLAAYAQFIVDCANPKQTDAAVHPFS